MKEYDLRLNILNLLKKNDYRATFQKINDRKFQLRFDTYGLVVDYEIDKDNKKINIIRENPDIIINIGPVPDYAYLSTIFVDICKQVTKYGYAVDLVSLLNENNEETTLEQIMELPEDVRDKEIILMNLTLLATESDVFEYAQEYEVVDGFNFVQCLLGV